jgi:hypothetical protein
MAGAHQSSKQVLSNVDVVKDDGRKEDPNARSSHHPTRLDSYGAKLVFQKNDFSYFNKIAEPSRDGRAKGFPPSSLFESLLLMYLLSMNSLLELIRFLNIYYDCVLLLGLKRNIWGSPKYIVPNRTAFNHFVNRPGPDRIVEILAVMVCRLMKMGVIK